MINKKTKREIAVMEAFLDGKCIQVSIKGGQWLDTPIPAWNWGYCDYRIVDRKSRKPFSAGLMCETRTREYIEVMRAHLQGKTIQYRNCGWKDIDFPIWNWMEVEYRVKHEKGDM